MQGLFTANFFSVINAPVFSYTLKNMSFRGEVTIWH